jgi:diguanylate cyclase (GGDEF)-like protein
VIRQSTWWGRLAALDDERLLAWMLSAAFLFGGALSSLYLFAAGAVRPGTATTVYVVTVGCSLVAGVVLAVRPRLHNRAALGWVLLADLLYTLSAVTLYDPERLASPVRLLFATVVAAWFLPIQALAAHLAAIFAISWVVLGPTGDLYLHLVQVTLQVGMLGGAGAAIYLLRRRTQRLLAATRQASMTDALTGLPNRRHLESRMPQFWTSARREGDLLAAFVLDLDHFKQINDAHGHAMGDQVLQAVAAAVRRCLREQDVVARTGGEEIVVLSQVPGTEEAMAMADRLRHEVATIPLPVRITASVGVAALGPAETVDAVEATWRLIEIADGAMYQAKHQGRNRCVLVEVHDAGATT